MNGDDAMSDYLPNGNLKTIMKDAGLYAKQLAELSGVSKSSVLSAMKDYRDDARVRPMRLETMQKIETALKNHFDSNIELLNFAIDADLASQHSGQRRPAGKASRASGQSRDEDVDKEVWHEPRRARHPHFKINGEVLMGGDICFGRDIQIKQLDQLWRKESTRIVQLVGRGGEGKTTLVDTWQTALAGDDAGYDGARNVFIRSLNGQGLSCDASASGDAMTEALSFFEVQEADKLSPHERGHRLAAVVGAARNLVILDGIEPLLNPPGAVMGAYKEVRGVLESFLFHLQFEKRGLCVVTTRREIKELRKRREVIHVERLSQAAAQMLLERRQVTGSPEKINKAIEFMEWHALGLTWLGTYLRLQFDGDIEQLNCHDLPLSGGDHDESTKARAMIASYEEWFRANADARSEVALAILNFMGLFNRLPESECIKALRRQPIQGISDALISNGSEAAWKNAVKLLSDAQLVRSHKGQLHCHPLIREYFAEKLARNELQQATSAAHGVILDCLKAQPFPSNPNSFEDLMPTRDAIVHAQKAGRFSEGLKLYMSRILDRRSRDSRAFFAADELGEYQALTNLLMDFAQENGSSSGLDPDQLRIVWLHIIKYESSINGYAHKNVEAAIDACQALGNSTDFEIRLHLERAKNIFSLVRARFGDSLKSAREMKRLLQSIKLNYKLAESEMHWAFAAPLFYRGELDDALYHADSGKEFNEDFTINEHHPGIVNRCWAAWILALKGDIRQALGEVNNAVRTAQEDIKHQPSLCFALHFHTMILIMKGKDALEEVRNAWKEQDKVARGRMAFWSASAECFHAWIESQDGNIEDAIREMKMGIKHWKDGTDAMLAFSYWQNMFAEMLIAARKYSSALEQINSGLDHAIGTRELFYVSDLCRQRAWLLSKDDEVPRVQTYLSIAHHFAKDQKADWFQNRVRETKKRIKPTISHLDKDQFRERRNELRYSDLTACRLISLLLGDDQTWYR